MSVQVISLLLVAGAFGSVSNAEQVPSIPKAVYQIVDDFSYSQQTAQTLWTPMTGSKPVSIVNVRGRKALKMPCNFRGTKIDRASWDRNLKLDLTMCKGLQFLFYCRDASPVGGFSVYLRSGNGWYRGRFDAPAPTDWATIRILKNDTDIEGYPAGWGKVDTIRISAWRGRDVDTEFYVAALGLFDTDGKIIVVRNDSASSVVPTEIEAIKQYTNVMAQFLDRAGLSYIILSDLDVTKERLKGKDLIILPHNPRMPDNVANEIAQCLRTGGKLIACYCLPLPLQQVTGIQIGAHIRQDYRGQFASIHPSNKPLRGLPAITHQASWNIHQASAVQGRGRVAAWWYTDSGASTGRPAIVVSENCVFLTHVLLSDDQDKKLQLLLAMVGNLVPELWREAAKGCFDRVGKFGPFADYDSAVRGMKALVSGGSPAMQALDRAAGLRDQGLNLLSDAKFSEAIIAAEGARKSIVEAYCLAQKPLPGEHRAFWCHSAFGVSDMSWDQTIRLLADNGFTAIVPNMLWGGVAFYRSDLLPVAKDVEVKGDQIELCVAACKKYGIECHIWKVNYNMGSAANEAFMARMKVQGRTQVNYDGSSNDRWLCPSHPENQRLETESMIEVARKYDVDGLHFDYIRYPNRDACFCAGCRLRFEKAIGRKVNNWPADVRNDEPRERKDPAFAAASAESANQLGNLTRGTLSRGERLSEHWLDFRRRQITAVVAAVAEQAKKVRPGIKTSAAVFRNWPADRDSVGQDWRLWCDKGYLDFVCPMDYTPSSSHFRRLVEQQLIWAGKVPCYPGIGLSVWGDSADICKLIEQINITRELGTRGFTIFNYGPTEAKEVLPLLGRGMTRKQ